MGGIVVSGKRIRDHKPFGRLTFAQVLAKSSNVGVIKAALLVGDQRLYKTIRAFGFGRPTGIDLPGESSGILHPDGALGDARQGLHLVRPGDLGHAAPARLGGGGGGQRAARC